MNSIEIIDNFLEEEYFKGVLEYCLHSSYTYGEWDMNDTPPTGMVHEIGKKEKIYKLLSSQIKKVYPQVRKLNLDRMYVNCFAPSENPYFHTDGDDGITVLYYVNDHWVPNDGGETQILVKDSGGINEIKGILPVPNRIICFDAIFLHRATSFRSKHRFTLAAKFS